MLDKGHIWFYSSRYLLLIVVPFNNYLTKSCSNEKRRIYKGEELCYDYNYPLVKDLAWLEERKCLCGDRECVGYMVGNIYHGELKEFLKELEKQQQRKQKNSKAL